MDFSVSALSKDFPVLLSKTLLKRDFYNIDNPSVSISRQVSTDTLMKNG
ncbi:hypothetical protein NPIL_675781, partial [Nephila pilipes]